MPAPAPPRLPRATDLAHLWLSERLRPGDAAIDATVGNGHDTVFLARAVGPGGTVVGFDLQEPALQATRHRCDRAGMGGRVILHRACHGRLAEILGADGGAPPRFRAAMFNLGYLPGGDKTFVTRPETTLAGLEGALRCLVPGGLLTVVAYPGHPGGEAETRAVETWAGALDPERFSAASYRGLNQRNHPPRLLAVERRLPLPESGPT